MKGIVNKDRVIRKGTKEQQMEAVRKMHSPIGINLEVPTPKPQPQPRQAT